MVLNPGIFTVNIFLSKSIFGKNSTYILRFHMVYAAEAQILTRIDYRPPNATAFGSEDFRFGFSGRLEITNGVRYRHESHFLQKLCDFSLILI
jgi:hypothetical protein